MVMLAGINSAYVRMLDYQSIFLPTHQFLKECMELPGFVNTWLAAFATQFCYYPWLGATIFTLALTAIAVLCYKAFRLPARWMSLAYIPSILLLLSTLTWGYTLFSLKPTSVVMGIVLGTLIAMLAFWGYTLIKRPALRLIAIIVIVIVGYPCFGFYALLCAALCVIREITGRESKLCWAIAAAGIALIAAVPPVYYRYATTILMSHDMYTTGLPILISEHEGDHAQGIPYFAAFGVMAVLCILSGHWKAETRHPHRSEGISIACFFLGLILVVCGRFRDANFDTSTAMAIDIVEGNWEDAIKHREKLKVTPTRINVLLTDIALMRMGQAGDRMFEFLNGATPVDCPRKVTATRDVAAIPVSMHFGRINNAIRWGMEYKVEYGLRIYYLKYMVKTALLEGEYALAQKYINTLKQTTFHKDFAERYQKLVDNPELIASDPELKQITPLTFFKDRLGGDGGKLEGYLLPIISTLRGGTPELVELTLQCNLIEKEIDEFMSRFGPIGKQYERIPKHYQEAALLWSMLHENQAYKYFNIDPKLVTRFKQFNQMAKAHQHDSPEQKLEIFGPLFGDTYWYYFFFVLDLKTN